ncbi:MAG: cellulase family glycosylhydrolase [Ignisphaera sp.]|nr:cellulase family glycosylhydrolase [Ignisphaera sp.]
MEVRKAGDVILVGGGFKFLLGLNYWPRKLNIRMWRDWDEKAIEEDIKLMKSLGIRAIRFFIKDEDFADEDTNVYTQSIEKLRKFLDILNKNNIAGFATLIVGHMSGKNWRIPWTRFEDLYASSSIEKTMKFIERIVKEFKDHPAIAGWILSNELSLVKRASNREEALALLRAFAGTVKSVDNAHVISSGDVPDSYMQETPNVRGFVDYIGPHLYLYDTDLVRHGYMYGAMLELFSNSGDVPVILEEFGFSTHQYSEESQARFINEVLYTALAHGASGAFIWCFSDFIHESDPPYEWRPLELGFGIVRKDGSLKPAAEVVKRFAKEVEEIEKLGIHTRFKRRAEASVIIPFYMFKDYEFIWYKNALGFWKLIQPLIALNILFSSAGVDNTMIFELDIEKVFRARKLLAMPSTILALSSTWRKLLEYVESGGSLYISLAKGFGEFKAMHESATHLWQELLGIENTLEAGSVGHVYVGRIRLGFVKGFGSIRGGEAVELETSTPLYTYTARPVDAEVLAVDLDGKPVMFRARRGKGQVYVSLIPIELIQAISSSMDWSGKVQKVFRSIAVDAGISINYESSSPEVEVKIFYGSGEDMLIAINHGNEKKVLLQSMQKVMDVAKVGGDATVVTWSGNSIELAMPKKSAIVLHVKH